jgi:hypothetical protein
LLAMAVLLGLTLAGLLPILPSARSSTTALAATWVSQILLLLLVLTVKPVVARRRDRQSVQEYWSTPKIRLSVFVVWSLIVAAGLVAAVSWLVSGQMVPALATASATVAYWLCGPDAFAKEA